MTAKRFGREKRARLTRPLASSTQQAVLGVNPRPERAKTRAQRHCNLVYRGVAWTEINKGCDITSSGVSGYVHVNWQHGICCSQPRQHVGQSAGEHSERHSVNQAVSDFTDDGSS